MTVPLSPVRRALAPLAILLLSGCASVGPQWHGAPPVAPTATARGHFFRADAAAETAAPAARWWQVFGDTVLDDLEARALAGSPDLAAAQARIANARAAEAASRSAAAPSLGLGAVAGEVSLPGALLGRDGRLSEQVYGDNAQASWEADLFGTQRRRDEAAHDRADAAAAQGADVAVALTAAVAQTYVDLRAEQANAALITQQVAIDRGQIEHAAGRLQGGTAPAQALANARATLAQSEADLADSRARIITLTDQLALLTGAEPGALDGVLTPVAAVPMVPARVAVGDPAALLRHRPDVRAAERQLAAATADIGARMADRLPSISFTGILGLGGTTVGDAFNPATLIGLVVPQIKWTPFDGGRGAALVRQAQSARDEAEAQYRGKVLTALNDAETALVRFGTQRISLARAIEQRDNARDVARLQALRSHDGTVSAADAELARRQALRAELGVNAAQARLTADFIAVEKALGLGWDSAAPAPK
jgi:NodT family efflux transporter outer membrane factor (OMF) lipoprotein